jgi:hypothetical protein
MCAGLKASMRTVVRPGVVATYLLEQTGRPSEAEMDRQAI